MARTRPSEFAKLVIEQVAYIKEYNKTTKSIYTPKRNSSHNIDSEDNNRKNFSYVFLKDEICKIGLIKGKDAFVEAANMLSLLNPMNPLTYQEDLNMQISDDKDDWVNKDYLELYLEDKSSYLPYKLFGFHFDLGVADALTSVILQIVDDNCFNYQRRNNILNPMYQYMGIVNKKINNHFCVYLTFGR